MPHFGDATSFIEAARRLEGEDELRSLMGGVTREMGFDSFALVHNVRHGHRAPRHCVSNHPPEYVDLYFRRWRAEDPIAKASSKTSWGFRFDEIPSFIRVSATAKEAMDEARRAGLADGFCVPIHIPGELDGRCTFTVRGDTALPIRSLPMAHLIGAFANEAARRLLWSSPRWPPQMTGTLTTRQLDCVRLVGKGKADREIAQLLGIGEDTVTAHLNEARRRYGVKRRAELPLQALFRGDLHFADMVS